MRTGVLSTFLILFLVFSCSDPEISKDQTAVKQPSSPYFNHHDSARYVGMNSCRSCHQEIYNSFLKTGMGSSFGIATREKSSAGFERAHLYDQFSDFHYQALWNDDSLSIKEYRLDG